MGASSSKPRGKVLMGNRAYYRSLEGGPKDPLAKAEMRELPDPSNKGKYIGEAFKIVGDAAATAGSVVPGIGGIAAGAYKALGPKANKYWEYDKEGNLNAIGKFTRVAEAAPMVLGLGATIANAARSVPALQRAGQAAGAEVRRVTDIAAREGRRALDMAKQRTGLLGRPIDAASRGLRTPSYTMRVPSAGRLRDASSEVFNFDTGVTRAGRALNQSAGERLASRTDFAPRVRSGVPPSQRLGGVNGGGGLSGLVRNRQARVAAQRFVDQANRSAVSDSVGRATAPVPPLLGDPYSNMNFMAGPNVAASNMARALNNVGVL